MHALEGKDDDEVSDDGSETFFDGNYGIRSELPGARQARDSELCFSRMVVTMALIPPQSYASCRRRQNPHLNLQFHTIPII